MSNAVPKKPMTFFRTFMAAFLASVAFLFLIFLFFVLLAAGSAGKDKPVVKDNSILRLKLNGPLVESAAPDAFDFSFDGLLPFDASAKGVGLYQTVAAIRHAKNDKHIRGIYLDFGVGLDGGWATMQTLRNALKEFRAAGKFIYAYNEFYTEKTYYLASVSDSIFMAPPGMMEFNGLSTTPMYYTGLFEKLEVKPEIFKVGTFKSAVEPYFRKDMSAENRTQVMEFLGDIWGIALREIAESRGTTVEKLNEAATNGVFMDGAEAVKYGLIHKAAYEEHVRLALRKASGIADEDEKLRFISLGDYMRIPDESVKDSDNKVAVIVAQGAIQSGKSSDDVIGSETVIKQLREAREDKNVKAVVLRVNSPGGSALASDVMNEEIRLTRKVKPVIASMGDVAASGGYYISSNCDKIFAQENTITGSIGIFGILYNTKAMFNNKLGITFDHASTNENADFANPNFPFTEAQRAKMQAYIEKGYGTFVNVVKTGRGFADSVSVDRIAQGRVWSGADAKGIKLIDEYGNLYDAIAAAAKIAGVEGDYEVKLLPEQKSRIEKFMEELGQSYVSWTASQNPLAQEMEDLKMIRQSVPQPGVYMLMPYTFVIE